MISKLKNEKLKQWVQEVADLCQPDDVYVCDGTQKEYDQMIARLISAGSATPLKKRPNSFLFRSDPSDVARVEDRTYISTPSQDEAGPTNNWIDPGELKTTMTDLYTGCMKGRTMYVIPFSMGPIGSPISKIGIEITDSPYVVCNMHIMTRVGTRVLEALSADGTFIPCLHSIGAPLEKGQKDVTWPCAPMEQKYISHFPDEAGRELRIRLQSHMVVWLRVWRQCPSREKVSRPEDCFSYGSPRRMDGRTYADSPPDKS